MSRLVLAGGESWHLTFREHGVRNVLVSYHYLRHQTDFDDMLKWFEAEKAKSPDRIFLVLDSGAYTFKVQGAGKLSLDEYADEYISFLEENPAARVFDLIAEFDVYEDDYGVEDYARVMRWRDRIHQAVGRRAMPVFIPDRDNAEHVEIARDPRFDWVAVASGFSGEVPAQKRLIDLAHSYGKRVHGFGMTRLLTDFKYLRNYDSIDSTTWLRSDRFGGTFIYWGQMVGGGQGNRLHVIGGDRKFERDSHKRYFTRMGLDWRKILGKWGEHDDDCPGPDAGTKGCPACRAQLLELRANSVIAWREMGAQMERTRTSNPMPPFQPHHSHLALADNKPPAFPELAIGPAHAPARLPAHATATIDEIWPGATDTDRVISLPIAAHNSRTKTIAMKPPVPKSFANPRLVKEPKIASSRRPRPDLTRKPGKGHFGLRRPDGEPIETRPTSLALQPFGPSVYDVPEPPPAPPRDLSPFAGFDCPHFRERPKGLVATPTCQVCENLHTCFELEYPDFGKPPSRECIYSPVKDSDPIPARPTIGDKRYFHWFMAFERCKLRRVNNDPRYNPQETIQEIITNAAINECTPLFSYQAEPESHDSDSPIQGEHEEADVGGHDDESTHLSTPRTNGDDAAASREDPPVPGDAGRAEEGPGPLTQDVRHLATDGDRTELLVLGEGPPSSGKEPRQELDLGAHRRRGDTHGEIRCGAEGDTKSDAPAMGRELLKRDVQGRKILQDTGIRGEDRHTNLQATHDDTTTANPREMPPAHTHLTTQELEDNDSHSTDERSSTSSDPSTTRESERPEGGPTTLVGE